MRAALIAAVVSMLWAVSTNAADAPGEEGYEAYELGGPIGSEMAAEFLNENRNALNAIAILEACHHSELAKAVTDRIPDLNFSERIARYIEHGKFAGTPDPSILHAQSGAERFSAGYRFGMIQALKMTVDPARDTDVCATGLQMGNDLLK
jgi:hypothetical protein